MKVEISEEIAKVLKKRVEDTEEFKDVDAYVDYILKQVVEKLEGDHTPTQLSEKQEKEVEDQLKHLGYLD